MPLTGTPVDEAECRRAWTALPLRVRTPCTADASTIWTPVLQLFWYRFCAPLGAPPEYIQACRHFLCDACEDTKPKQQSTKGALPKDYVFGRNLGIDLLEVKDIDGEFYLCSNILDLGTTFQQVVLLATGARVAV